MLQTLLFLGSLFFLIGTALLSALINSFRSLHKRESEKTIRSIGFKFFYKPFHSFLFPQNEFEGLFFATTVSLNITRYLFAAFSFTHLLTSETFKHFLSHIESFSYLTTDLLFVLLWGYLILFFSFFIGDYIPRSISTRYPETSLYFCAPLASLFLFLSFPIAYLFLLLAQKFPHSLYFDYIHESDTQAKQELIDMIKESVLTEELATNEKKINFLCPLFL